MKDEGCRRDAGVRGTPIEQGLDRRLVREELIEGLPPATLDRLLEERIGEGVFTQKAPVHHWAGVRIAPSNSEGDPARQRQIVADQAGSRQRRCASRIAPS